jgi:8-oxo-dGTP pyrophosphatase MutT (NUDIX family)
LPGDGAVTGGESTPRQTDPTGDDPVQDAFDEDAGLKPGTRGPKRWLVLAFRLALSGVMLWFLLSKIGDSQSPDLPEWNRSTAFWLTGAMLLTLAGIVPRAEGAQVILTRRTETLRQHGGQVGFPGGRTEPDDRDAVAAALRESQEEIALPPEQVQVLGYLDPFVTITGYRVMPVVAVIDPAFVAVPQPDEVAEVFEVPLAYLMDPDNLRHVDIEHRGRVRHVLEYGWPGQRIWGATAAILYNLRRRLEQTE